MTTLQTRSQSPRLPGPVAHARPGEAGLAAGMTFKDLLRIVRKRKWLIILSWLVIMAITITVTELWLLYAPFYTARSLLQVNPTEPTLLNMAKAPPVAREIMDRFKRTQAALVKQQPVLEAAAKDEELRAQAPSWYNKYKSRLLQELDEQINVSVVPETDLIELSMTGMNQKELPEIINAMARAFVNFTSEGARRGQQNNITKLQSQVGDLKKRLESLGRDRADALGASPMAAMQERLNVVSLKLQNLVVKVQEAEALQADWESRLKDWEKNVRSGQVANDPMLVRAMDEDGTLRQLKYRQAELETALENAHQKYGLQSRQVKNLENMEEAVKRQAEDRGKELMQLTIQSVGQGIANEYNKATDNLSKILERQNQAKVEAHDLEQALQRISRLTNDISDTDAQIKKINDAILEMTLVLRGTGPGGESVNLGPVTVVAVATQPREPSMPNWSLMIPAGFALGLMVGFGLAFLLELTDSSVRSPSDLTRKMNFPLLGMVPHSDDLEEEVADFRKVVLLAPQSPAAEAFRHIRTNLLFSGPAEHRRTLLITSPAPEDGRTTVVLNLAAAMAQGGKRVLVVDANFRQPAIAAMFPSASAAGLSSALVGQASWRDVVSPTETPNMSVIAAGPLPPNPADLLGSEQMRQLLAEMMAEYDQVLIDGSPIMVVSDAVVLSTMVDGVIMVVRAGSNSVGIVQRAAEQLAKVGAHVTGIILLGVRSTAGGYLRKNYQTFYDYHQKPPELP